MIITRELLTILIAGAVKHHAVSPVLLNIRPDFFDAKFEADLQLVFVSFREYLLQYKAIPDRPIIERYVKAKLDAADWPIENANLVFKTIQEVCELIPLDSITPEITESIYQHLVNRYFSIRCRENLNPLLGERFRGTFESLYKQYASLFEVGGYPDVEQIPEDVRQLFPIQGFHSTGISFFDEMMSGGCCEKETYVLLGPTGGKKSLLSLQLCTARSELAYYNNYDEVNVYFSYELPRNDVILRAISQAAKIPPFRLREIAMSDGRPSTEPQSYEDELFRYSNNPYMCEADRFDLSRTFLQRYCRFVDYSGNVVNGKSYGSGGLQEVSNYLKALQDKTGSPIRFVVLDWAGAAVRRELEGLNRNDVKNIINGLYGYVQRAFELIAGPHECSVWVVHQLSGNSLSKSSRALKPIHHSEAQWCHSFADYAWYAFVLSMEDKEYRIQVLNCSKSRRSDSVKPRLVQLTPYLTLKDVSSLFCFDADLQMITPSYEDVNASPDF
ncbi:MAG: hypothetical protein KatS3mg087_0029 [Patescibacteria group bacterium]|nr:MAG: hypothetical protein KatS3mg087_0029 [Patescibacteria group bacterium]